ncbi:WxL domain-containing protein [Lacticaseibacillus porcinae]|uniref:WxL domain-containing protein n=1 Tax=Lacticaseibacillus porcinae TaxID=1123687 RepID=UPI0013DE095A|nr:WxL domain-containing protein [Lacticaseibacillus porcinae]
MIKSLSFTRLVALSTSIIAAGLLALATPHTVHADTTTQATVEFSMPENAAVSIKAMPNLDFGTKQITTSGADYTADSVSAPVEVTNPGFQEGWTLNVEASNFATADQSRSIKGAELTFAHTDVNPTDDTNISAKPTTEQAGTTIQAGAAGATLISADKGAGIGTYQANYTPSSVSLHVPAGNVAADYSANLNWTMTNSLA